MNIKTGVLNDETICLDKYIIDKFTYYNGRFDDVKTDDLLESFAALMNVLADKGIIGETAVKGILNDPYGFDFEE